MTERPDGQPCTCEEFALTERNNHTASCNRNSRKQAKEDAKPKKGAKPIAKVGKNNTFECSDGTRVKQVVIDRHLSQLRKLIFSQEVYVWCAGCKMTYTHSIAHIIAKARCKVIGKTELIWDINNVFPGCFKCNQQAENISSPAIMQLKNYAHIKAFMLANDFERASKLPDFKLIEPHKI